MFIEWTVTFLEMTSPDALRPGRAPPAPVELQAGDRSLAPLLRSASDRVGEPYGWSSRLTWSDERWAEHVARPAVHAYVARVGGEVAGIVELEARPADEVEITVFGLVPELVGRGFGGHLLTLATRLAWEVEHPGGAATRRVWLHTASTDNPHALANYQGRGFRAFRTEVRRKQVPATG